MSVTINLHGVIVAINTIEGTARLTDQRDGSSKTIGIDELATLLRLFIEYNASEFTNPS